MDDASAALMNLRPVTFLHDADQDAARRTVQYGPIADGVNNVYPGRIADSADGRIETVMYQLLPPMPLDAYQMQQRTIEAQRTEPSGPTVRIAELERDALQHNARLADRMQKAGALAADVAVQKATLAALQRTRANVAAR